MTKSLTQKNAIYLSSAIASMILIGIAWWYSPPNASTRYERMSLLDLRNHLDSAPKDATGWHVFALRLAHDGDAGLAESALRQALELNPKDPEAATALGELLISTARYPEASQWLKQTIGNRPQYIPAHRALGLLYRKRGSYAHAIEEFQTVLKADEKDGDIWYQSAHCYWNMQQVANTQNALKKALQAEPDNPAYLTLSGNVQAAVGNLQPGIAQIARAVALAPTNLTAHESLVTLLIQHGSGNEDMTKIEQSLKKIAILNPNYPLLPYFNGQLEAKRGNWLAAIPYLEESVTQTPSYDAAYLALSQAYRRVKRTAEADKMQQTYEMRQTTQKAIDDVKEELGRRPKDVKLLLKLGDLLYRRGDYSEALTNLETANTLEPNSAQILQHIETLKKLTGKTQASQKTTDFDRSRNQ